VFVPVGYIQIGTADTNGVKSHQNCRTIKYSTARGSVAQGLKALLPLLTHVGWFLLVAEVQAPDGSGRKVGGQQKAGATRSGGW
jgi:hypothetical protein